MGADSNQGTSWQPKGPGRRPPAITKEDAVLDAKDETIALLHQQLAAERQDRAEERRVLVNLIERLMAQLGLHEEKSRGAPWRSRIFGGG
jgi:hypothetical protein